MLIGRQGTRIGILRLLKNTLKCHLRLTAVAVGLDKLNPRPALQGRDNPRGPEGGRYLGRQHGEGEGNREGRT